MSQTKAIALHDAFDDGRSISARRYRTAQQCTKPERVKSMVKRALNRGIVADYLLADAWWHQGHDTLKPRNVISAGASNEEK
jgi:hypothetical protein